MWFGPDCVDHCVCLCATVYHFLSAVSPPLGPLPPRRVARPPHHRSFSSILRAGSPFSPAGSSARPVLYNRCVHVHREDVCSWLTGVSFFLIVRLCVGGAICLRILVIQDDFSPAVWKNSGGLNGGDLRERMGVAMQCGLGQIVSIRCIPPAACRPPPPAPCMF